MNCKAGETSCWSASAGDITVQPSSNDSGRSGRARQEPRLLTTALREGWRLAGAASYGVSDKASVSDLSKRYSLS